MTTSSFKILGLEQDAGTAYGIRVTTKATEIEGGIIHWERVAVDYVELHAVAHIHLVQGLSLANLLYTSSLPDIRVMSPLFYIAGTVTKPWVVPCRIQDLVLGRLKEGPRDLTIKKMLFALLGDEVASRR